MNFEKLQRRVQRAEQLVEGRMQQTQGHWIMLRHAWGDAWTPGRIVIAGLVSGFLAGRAEPLKSMTGARWLQMVGSVSSLFASLQAATAAGEASVAADTAGEAADTAQAVQENAAMQDAGVASAPHPAAAPRVAAREHAEISATAPRPAEAATELSER